MKILLLAGNTLRARSYAQILAAQVENNFEVEAIFYGFNKKECLDIEVDDDTEHFFKSEKLFIPDLTESIKSTFKKIKWKYTDIEETDVNSDVILNELKKFDGDIIIFAGYGGQILKAKHFEIGKKYLHMHPGRIPMERGSTTIYYSILNKRRCSVTGFYMSERIDDGINIMIKEYKVPYKNVNIDLWYDNIIRADCFIETLSKIVNRKELPENVIESSEEYYVIHPVLKHVALLSLKEN